MIRVALPFGRTPEKKRIPYRKALEGVGVQAVEDAATLVGLDGLMLAGGTDVDPALYGAVTHPETGDPDRDRDGIEVRLVREAVARDLPVLAICRGLQMMNVAQGGSLVQHIERHRCPELRDAHPITIEAGSRLQSILRGGEFFVNSRHHQCADRVANGLAVVGRAEDGVIEALEMPGKRFVVAVQWHPEDRGDGPDGKLFAAFRDAMSSAPR
jgi:putative glutamine amidotransferase